MHEPNVEEIKKHVRTYILVFVALMALTIITVAVSYLHLDVKWAIAVALLIATIKGSLVAGFFMHLISEKRLIYFTLILTFIFFLVLMVLPTSGYSDRVI